MPERSGRVLVTVKTYPNPSAKYEETVCVAGLDLDLGRFVRLYPIRLRNLPYSQWFKKWQVIEADLTHKVADCRGDTYTPDPVSIRTVDAFYKGPQADSFHGSIGLVRITTDSEFYLTPGVAEWSAKQLSIMNQASLFESSRKPLQKIPWDFRYKFKCADSPECTGHDLQVFDWEPYELYRKQLLRWPAEKAHDDLLHKYNEAIGPRSRNVYLFVGTTISRPKQFSCIGIYAPPG